MWSVYILLCSGGTYYTGITNDLDKRFAAHQAGNGSAYTRSHPALKIVYSESYPDKSSALRREAALKHLSHRQKHSLSAPGF